MAVTEGGLVGTGGLLWVSYRCLHLSAALEKGHFIPQRMQKWLKRRLSTGVVHRNTFFLNLLLLLQTELAAIREDILMLRCDHLN